MKHNSKASTQRIKPVSCDAKRKTAQQCKAKQSRKTKQANAKTSHALA